jgi:lysophospholipase L1-like esterase
MRRQQTILAVVAVLLLTAGAVVLSSGIRLPAGRGGAAQVSASTNTAPQKALRIMPLGDSITQGRYNAESYRRPLWKMIEETGVRVDFVGSMTKNYPASPPPRTDFDMDHEGHWGWSVFDVLRRIDNWAGQARPDIVLIHLGTNDMHGRRHEDTVEGLRQIIAILRKHTPGIKVFLAMIIPVADVAGDAAIQEYNKLLRGMAGTVSTEASPVYIVDQHEGFDAYKDTSDGVHPNESGIQKMAQKWFEALSVLPEFKK